MFSRIILGIESLIIIGMFLMVLLSDWKCLGHNFTERIRLYKIRKKRKE